MLLFMRVLCNKVENYEIFLMSIKGLMVKDGCSAWLGDLGPRANSLTFQFWLPVSKPFFLQDQVVS